MPTTIHKVPNQAIIPGVDLRAAGNVVPKRSSMFLRLWLAKRSLKRIAPAPAPIVAHPATDIATSSNVIAT